MVGSRYSRWPTPSSLDDSRTCAYVRKFGELSAILRIDCVVGVSVEAGQRVLLDLHLQHQFEHNNPVSHARVRPCREIYGAGIRRRLDKNSHVIDTSASF